MTCLTTSTMSRSCSATWISLCANGVTNPRVHNPRQSNGGYGGNQAKAKPESLRIVALKDKPAFMFDGSAWSPAWRPDQHDPGQATYIIGQLFTRSLPAFASERFAAAPFAFMVAASTTKLSNSILELALMTGSIGTSSEGSYQGGFSTAPPSRACAISCPISCPLKGTSVPSSF